MKLIFLTIAGFFTCASISFAAPVAVGTAVPRVCHRNAERAVTRFVEPGYYDQNGIESVTCTVSPRGSAVICDVMASKGDGAANDSFRAVLNSNCSKTYRVELTGEE